MASVILRSINRNSDSTSPSSFKSFDVKIELPVTLGRGPIIKCPDKKISRNHAMIDWDDEGVLITSTHNKPTFVVRNGEEKCLTQGQSVVLNNGDIFGLLKDSYWYKVVVASSCDDERVIDSNKIGKESSPRCKKVQKESSPCLSSIESPTDKNENNPVCTDSNEVRLDLALEKDNDINEENVEPLINNNINTESNKIEDRKEEFDEKEDEIGSNLSETKYNPNNNRKRTLPNWMRKPAGKGESNEKKLNEKVKNVNEKQTKKKNVSRPSKKVMSLSKFHDCSDDDDSDDYHVKVSPKKRVNQRQIKQTKAKNQYHTVSQDLDSLDFRTEDNISEVISKNEVKTNINSNVCNGNGSDGDKRSPKKEAKRVNQRQIKKANAKNQYHSVSQDFDSPDFETKDNVSEAVGQNEIKANIDPIVCSGSVDIKVSPKKGTHKMNLETENNISETLNNNEIKANSSNVLDLKKVVTSHEKEHDLSDDDSDGGLDEPSRSKPTKIKISKELKKNTPRKSCQYGKDCYRSNPSHRKETAHPGDSDYVSHESASDDEDDDRPECEYGLNCYRKNPQHKKAFKHTKKPQPPRNAKRKGKRKNGDSDDSDEYDLDDSFFNDDSSDDYAPTDSSGPDSEIEDAVEEQDTKRMMKEAKKFVKKRRH